MSMASIPGWLRDSALYEALLCVRHYVYNEYGKYTRGWSHDSALYEALLCVRHYGCCCCYVFR
jgi:hypothetical protein